MTTLRASDLLPVGWDREIDVLLLAGEAAVPIVEELVRLGQRRTILFASPDEEVAVPPPVLVVRSLDELRYALLTWPGPAFARFDGRLLGPVGVAPDAIARIYRAGLRAWQDRRFTTAVHGDRAIFQLLDNLPALARRPSIDSLRGLFRGRPAILLGTGPSVALHRDQIAASAGKVLLMAETASLPALERLGIVPDVVLSWGLVDPMLGQCPHEAYRALVTSPWNASAWVGTVPELLFSYATNSRLDSWALGSLDVASRLPCMPFPSVALLQLAFHVHADPILLVGYEFDSGASEQGWTGPDERFVSVQAWPGGPRRVPFSSSLAVRALSYLATAFGVHGSVVQCSVDGPYIEGAEHLDLERALANLGAVPGLSRGTLAQASEDVDLDHRYRILRARILERRAGLADLLRLFDECRSHLHGVLATDRTRQEARQRLAAAVSSRPLVSIFRREELEAAFEGGLTRPRPQAIEACGQLLGEIARTLDSALGSTLERVPVVGAGRS